MGNQKIHGFSVRVDISAVIYTRWKFNRSLVWPLLTDPSVFVFRTGKRQLRKLLMSVRYSMVSYKPKI